MALNSIVMRFYMYTFNSADNFINDVYVINSYGRNGHSRLPTMVPTVNTLLSDTKSATKTVKH